MKKFELSFISYQKAFSALRMIVCSPLVLFSPVAFYYLLFFLGIPLLLVLGGAPIDQLFSDVTIKGLAGGSGHTGLISIVPSLLSVPVFFMDIHLFRKYRERQNQLKEEVFYSALKLWKKTFWLNFLLLIISLVVITLILMAMNYHNHKELFLLYIISIPFLISSHGSFKLWRHEKKKLT